MTGVEASAISAVVSGTLKIVCNKLAPLLIKEYSSIVGVKEDLQELHDLVKEINFWLETATGNSVGSAWLQKLKDISYDVDDVVDEFQLKAEKHDSDGDSGIVSKYLYTIPKSFAFQCKAANKIKAIKKRFAAIVKQRTDYLAITNSLSRDPHVRPINTKSMEVPVLPNVDEAFVVGRDKDKKKIISMLQENDGQQKIKIISVIGLGGSGKTTLARLVFNDDNITEKNFELRLWVHVSQEFDVKDLIRKLFEAFSDNNPGPHALPYMTKKISEKLMGKRFLLVLDDVWTKSRDEWEEFMVYIKGGAPKSRILLTTRNREVAVIVGSTDQFHLPFLSLDDSWQLFQQSLVTPATSGWNFEFEEVGKAIVDRCGGVPLAIKVLAGALHGRDRIEEWQAMRDKKLSNSNGNGNKEDTVAACLRLSYFHLPSNLKQCFTICSLFPKGHKIDKEQLIDLWIAHDMITLEDDVDCLSLEYVGHKYFNSLLQVSFLQNVEEKDGRVTCGVHDLVHDLALSILGDEISLDVPNEATSATKSHRYFSLIKRPENLAPRDFFRKARAVYMPWYADYKYGMALKHAKHLRSVRVESIDAEEANTISQVKYLKYFAMSVSCEKLPETISDVWNLQALHVTHSLSLLELPKSIGKLKKLRTLNLSGCYNLKNLPESIGDCQMISSIDLSNCKELTVLPDSIGRNVKLRVLRLSHTKIKRLPSIITTLRKLECLDLQDCRELVELPDGMVKMENLQVLNLKLCKKLGGMPIGIGQLNRLQKLGLFVVGKGEKFGGISELANVSKIGEELRIEGISHMMDPDDGRKACLKQKTNLQRLELQWMTRDAEEVDTELEHTVLDGLEPPPGIKELAIYGYSGRQYAQWMLTEVGGRVPGLPRFPFLKVMVLFNLLNLQHLNGLVGMPCLEELKLINMPSLESISGGPFPSLVWLTMDELTSLEDVWVLGEKIIPEGEEVGGYNNCTPGLEQVQVGDCVTDLDITDSLKLKVKLHLPSSLQLLSLFGISEHLLQAPGQCEGSYSSSSFGHLKKLDLQRMIGLGPRGGWGLLQHMRALESLEIKYSNELTELPESLGSLTSLRSLKVDSCPGIRRLPESIGKLHSLQELAIEGCTSLDSLPQSMGHLTSLQELVIEYCHALEQLPDCLGELSSLRRLMIGYCPGITSLSEGMSSLISLTELCIRYCPGLTSLLHRMKGLVSLQKLTIWHCLGIKSLPEDIRGLADLKELTIYDCPYLELRCERGKGEDWHLISHIPDLYIWGPDWP